MPTVARSRFRRAKVGGEGGIRARQEPLGGRTEGRRRLGRVLQEVEHAHAVPGAQPDALVASDDLLRDRQGRPHDERRQIQALVGGRRRIDLLFLAPACGLRGMSQRARARADEGKKVRVPQFPEKPNLEWLRKQAKRRLVELRRMNPQARGDYSNARGPRGWLRHRRRLTQPILARIADMNVGAGFPRRGTADPDGPDQSGRLGGYGIPGGHLPSSRSTRMPAGRIRICLTHSR